MKLRSIILILVCISMIFSFAACTSKIDIAADKKDDPENGEIFTYILENVFTKGDIQPSYDMMFGGMEVFGYSEYTVDDETVLIDYKGKVMAELSSMNYQFCSLCGEFGNHIDALDPEKLTEVAANGGHGGYGWEFYDAETEQVFSMNYGAAYPVDYEVEYGVYPLAERAAATPEESDFTGLDYTYKFINEYALIIDNKIAERGFEYGITCDENGMAAICKDGKWGYYDSKGKMILGHEYLPSTHTIEDFYINSEYAIPYSASCGYIALNKDGKWAYADTKGNLVTDFIFEEARPVYMGKAWVKVNGAWSVISFSEYEPALTPLEAKQLITSDYDIASYKLSQVKSDYKFYGSTAYLFKSEQNGCETYYTVLYNGTIFVR